MNPGESIDVAGWRDSSAQIHYCLTDDALQPFLELTTPALGIRLATRDEVYAFCATLVDLADEHLP